MKIHTIIPAYKADDRLPEVLRCLRSSNDIDLDILIRDNTNDNIMFTRAVNEGLRRALRDPAAEFALVCSDDVFVREDCVKRLLMTIQERPKCAIVAPIQRNRVGEIVWAGSLNSWPQGVHVLNKPQDGPYPIYWTSGAIFLIRLDALREIGLLDENFIFICQDSDICLTARSRGWEVWVDPLAEVIHEFGGSASLANEELNRIKIRDVIRFTHKWITGGVFRSLEHDGEKITMAQVKHQIDLYERYLRGELK